MINSRGNEKQKTQHKKGNLMIMRELFELNVQHCSRVVACIRREPENSRFNNVRWEAFKFEALFNRDAVIPYNSAFPFASFSFCPALKFLYLFHFLEQPSSHIIQIHLQPHWRADETQSSRFVHLRRFHLASGADSGWLDRISRNRARPLEQLHA